MNNEKNYYMYKMNTSILNVLSCIIYIIIFGITYLLKDYFSFTSNAINVSIALCIPYLFLHEIIHSISYVVNGADFKNITYGCHLEKGILCCLCKQDIKRKNILISLLAPLFVLGFFPLIISFIFKFEILYILAMINIGGCSGDIVMFYHLSKIKNFEFSEYNDPIAFGLLGKKDLENRKMFGLDYVGKQTSLKRDDLKKVDASIGNIIALAILILSAITMLVI